MGHLAGCLTGHILNRVAFEVSHLPRDRDLFLQEGTCVQKISVLTGGGGGGGGGSV